MREPFIDGRCVECVRVMEGTHMTLQPVAPARSLTGLIVLLAIFGSLVGLFVLENLAGESGLTGGLIILSPFVAIPIVAVVALVIAVKYSCKVLAFIWKKV